ncbi:MAG: tRNA guanosine(34) transglycosylase Tgt [Cyclobacteriaceae bacterium]
MWFKAIKKDKNSKARAGELKTSHGLIETPIFMPVGTAGTVKAVNQRELKGDVQAQIILGNTYHLYLRPGIDLLEKAGGLHHFINWDRPMLTDSGGYQVYSLANSRKISEEGVQFQSHVDGSRHFFAPETAIDIQRSIGADIIMAFDECTPYPCEKKYARDSMNMTHRWLKRCQQHFTKNDSRYGYDQMLFPIVQGSVYPDLRKQSAEFIAEKNGPGNAIGGLSVGEPDELMYEMTELVCDILPEDKPRYLMGVGTPANIIENIALGVDMFDCVLPTRNARHGILYTSNGIINIRNEKWKEDLSPIDAANDCYVSQHFSKAYLRHLVYSKEILAMQIASIHNLSFYLWLVKKARQEIIAGTFLDWKNTIIPKISLRL